METVRESCQLKKKKKENFVLKDFDEGLCVHNFVASGEGRKQWISKKIEGSFREIIYNDFEACSWSISYNGFLK